MFARTEFVRQYMISSFLLVLLVRFYSNTSVMWYSNLIFRYIYIVKDIVTGEKSPFFIVFVLISSNMLSIEIQILFMSSRYTRDVFFGVSKRTLKLRMNSIVLIIFGLGGGKIQLKRDRKISKIF